MDIVVILAPAFVLSLILLVLHTYFGLHVLARGIIFVDLALAQIAALGVSVAFWLGHEEHGMTPYYYAIAATLLVALSFTQLRRIESKTGREVTIGVVYVVSTALSVLLLSQSSQGMEELKSLFNGNILWADWETVGWVGSIYFAIGLGHIIFRRQFIDISFHSGTRGFVWEFLFFASFAVAITTSVSVAGTLLVFAYLIIPAFSASLVATHLRSRLLVSWIGGALATLFGLWIAFVADLPVGATLVSVLGLLPVLAMLIKILKK